MPSAAERTVPIVCELLSDGMQSLVFDGVRARLRGLAAEEHGLRRTSVLSGFTVTRVRRETSGWSAADGFAS